MIPVSVLSCPLRRQIEFSPCVVTGKDGEDYTLRLIEPGDAASLIRGYDAMSEQAKWFRMLHTVPHLSENMARRFCSPDPDRDLCIVVIGHGKLQGEILGGARIAGESDGRRAEFSVSLRPEAHGLGLAHQVLRLVLRSAHEMGYDRVWGVIAVHNKAMLRLARHLGFTLAPDRNDVALIDAEIDLLTLASRDIPNTQVSFTPGRPIEPNLTANLPKFREHGQ